MADPLSVAVGVGVTSALLFFFSYILSEEDWMHYITKIVALFFALGFLLFIPSSLLDSKSVCSVVVNNTVVSGNVTTYQYTDFCYAQKTTVPNSFVKGMVWLYRIFVTILISWLFFASVKALWRSAGGKA